MLGVRPIRRATRRPRRRGERTLVVARNARTLLPVRALVSALAQFLQPSVDIGRPLTSTFGAAAESVVEHRELTMCLGSGAESATIWTCDLTAEYVRINGEYRT